MITPRCDYSSNPVHRGHRRRGQGGAAVVAAAASRLRLGLLATDAVDVVPFDFTQPAAIAPALNGVTGLLLGRPPAISDVRRYLLPVVRAAVAAGVEHVAFLSLQGA